MSRPESVAGSLPNLSHASRPLATKPRSVSPSNISLFVSNLRLLNLDQRQDWPDITIQTFDTKDALQNQKKRVSCVEWSLYRLFEIWDRETTRDKLQPFFPPLEPIQSLNLRAALFRCLNDLKKNDVLGREATLRKTMLDDCKGDKFEEVLLLFSAAVVRKHLLSTRRKQPSSIARNIALSRNIDKRDLSSIAPLSMAYRASLAKTLQSRATLDITLDNFRTSLYEKTNDYHQRHLTLLETQDPTIENLSPETEKLIRRELRQNWVGSIEGCDALLAGAKVASPDAYMDSRFDDLWQHFRQGTTPQVSPERISLLETLQSRVGEQNDRLRMWKAYKDVFEESHKPANPVGESSAPHRRECTAEAHGLDIFNKHKSIGVDHTPPESVDHSHIDLMVDYEQVLHDMKQGLSDVRKRKQKPHGQANHFAPSVDRIGRTNTMSRQAPIPVFLGGLHDPKEDLFSPLKRPLLESANSTPLNTRGEAHKTHQWLSRTHSQPVTTPQSTRSEYGLAMSSRNESPYGSALRQPEFVEPSPSVQRDRERYVKAHTPSSMGESEINSKNEEASPTITHVVSAECGHTDLVDDPVTSLRHKIDQMGLDEQKRSSPSPELPDYSPPTLSSPPVPISRHQSPQEQLNLSERARMSMASFRSSENSQPLPQPTHDVPTSTIDVEATVTQARRTSLADRALASMTQASLNPQPQPQRRTTTKERPKSSFFPSQLSTPLKSGRNSLGGTRDTTPRDKLFEQDAEYASVFKSRPKIAMSPVLSPGLDSQMEDAEDFSFEGDAEGTESMMELQSSPLGKFGM
ncbi:unnamed protein product [Aureobasidium vineae]|uniref:HAUS augmin-like complex subunit 6 N-terminal domain-containing protein n=1 Tax=Aureobasidium vineae TaxID=2773715 RepID=A0A9N8J7C3_9PEZI|nr:unnamed protein product [Aureobasidium vineae]